jgi:hypothetical protein
MSFKAESEAPSLAQTARYKSDAMEILSTCIILSFQLAFLMKNLFSGPSDCIMLSTPRHETLFSWKTETNLK